MQMCYRCLRSVAGGLTDQNSRFFISRKIASASLSSGASSGRVTSSVASYVFFLRFFSISADLAAFFLASASSFLSSIGSSESDCELLHAKLPRRAASGPDGLSSSGKLEVVLVPHGNVVDGPIPSRDDLV